MEDVMMMDRPLSEFPFPCFFIRHLGGSDTIADGDDVMKNQERIGGTFTHMETELVDQLKHFTTEKGGLKMPGVSPKKKSEEWMSEQ
mmetsp:Transcript_7879/g.7372  ORF Transcript_7879/g.7372 Transcript_7879/m.7372 type:complete len:87 (+) Transcript_7879:1957-2217(+)